MTYAPGLGWHARGQAVTNAQMLTKLLASE
jgi:hypothetical protein